MPQYVIDTLKPKNNNNFPVAEAVDVLYEEGSTVKDKIIAINALIVAAQQLIEGVQTDISELQTDVSELQSGKVDKVTGKGLSTNDFTSTYKSKVDNTYTKTETDTALAKKVDKVSGKGLSTNDFTNTYKNKIDNTYTKTETDSAIAGKIAEVVAEAPESFDTLKEIADWIDTHADSASAMNSAIQANAANIEKKVDKVEGKTLSSNDFTDVYKSKVDDTYVKAEVDSKLKDKVDKENGKGLSTNDFTDEYQARVHDAYANTIENASEIEKLKSSKADKTALSETNQNVENNRANLQGQIDALVLEAVGDSNLEVVQARVGSDGTIHNTLKSRLDDIDSTVSTKVNDVKSDLNYVLKETYDAWVYGLVNRDNTLTPDNTTYPKSFAHIKFDIDTIVTQKLYLCLTNNLYVPEIIIAIYDETGTKLNTNMWTQFTDGSPAFDAFEIKISYPTAKYIIVNVRLKTISGISVKIDTFDFINFVVSSESKLPVERIKFLEDKINAKNYYNDWRNGSIVGNTLIRDSAHSDKYMSIVIDMAEIEAETALKFAYTPVENLTAKYYLAYYDTNKNLLVGGGAWWKVKNDVIAIKSYNEISQQLSDVRYAAITVRFADEEDLNQQIYNINGIDLSLVESKKIEKNYVTVGALNCDYTSIADAVNGTQDGDTIVITPGRYEEAVHMWGKNRHIIGMNRESCILINGLGSYYEPPIEANIGSIENMTIISDTYDAEEPAEGEPNGQGYAIHVEHGETSPYSLTIRNCNINAKWNSAIGIGVRYNQTVTIENCLIVSSCEKAYSSSLGEWQDMGAIFMHNDVAESDKPGARLNIKKCTLEGKNVALTMYSVNNGCTMEALFANNTLYSTVNGTDKAINYYGQTPSPDCLAGDDIKLHVGSHANNILVLNK